MRHVEGRLADKPLTEIVRGIYRSARTGVLQLETDEQQERISFVAGDLFLDPHHRLAPILRVAGEAGDDHPGGDADRRSVARALAALWGGWTEGRYVFSEGEDKVAAERVGPLPTALVLMESVLAGDEFRLLRQLGGQDREFVAVVGERHGALELDPHEAFFVSRLERPVAVRDLLRQVELERAEALLRLCRLKAADLIRPREEVPEAAEKAVASHQMVRRFSDRIAEELRRKPLDLAVDVHRHRLKELVAKLGELTHFELLGVPVGADQDRIHDAYSELARLVHPSHGARLGLGGKTGGLELLFERATEAYLVLSDPERTRSYLDRIGSAVVSEQFQPTRAQRKQEIKELAAQKYRLAANYAAREEYHFAVQLLEQATEVDPQPEYLVLLGECQEHNPRWQERALWSFSHAVQLRRDDPGLRNRLAQCYEKMGQLDRAREEYEAALERMPGFPDAVAGLKRLKRPEAKAGATGGSFLGKLLSRFGRSGAEEG